MKPLSKSKWSIAAAGLSLAAMSGLAAVAQRSLGSVKTEGVEVAGVVTVTGGRAVIANNGSITANAQTAEVSLTRGGTVKVCTGSAARLSQPNVDVARPPLLMALDRGSLEIQTRAEKNDLILTPDFRFEISDAAPLNLHLRLVANGDTCVDNSGKDAPMLHVTESFGTGAYFIRPGQRVLFEHGSLREVVDHESSSCGCPKAEALVLAGKGKPGDGKVTEAARSNPFPEAVSQGVQQPTVPQAPSDQTHVQVSTTMNYSGPANTVTGPPGESTTPGGPVAAPANSSPAASGAAAPPPAVSTPPVVSTPQAAAPVPVTAKVENAAPPPAGPNPFRGIGHFFRRLFGGS